VPLKINFQEKKERKEDSTGIYTNLQFISSEYLNKLINFSHQSFLIYRTEIKIGTSQCFHKD
jgi:hypothetical protein